MEVTPHLTRQEKTFHPRMSKEITAYLGEKEKEDRESVSAVQETPHRVCYGELTHDRAGRVPWQRAEVSEGTLLLTPFSVLHGEAGDRAVLGVGCWGNQGGTITGAAQP